jgi:hypothetical protein
MLASFKAGNYTYIASVNHAGKVHESKGQFMVAAFTLESVNTSADHRSAQSFSNSQQEEKYSIPMNWKNFQPQF